MDRHEHSRMKWLPRWTEQLSSRSLLGVVLLTAIAGCDDKRDIPPVIPPTPATTQAAAPASRPTTQELQVAPRKRVVLGSFPLTLEVPPSWKLDATGSGIWLGGDAPHGEVRIQLTSQGTMLKQEAMIAMDKGARIKAASQPTVLQVSPLKPVNSAGTVQKMEQTEIVRHLPIVRDNGNVEYVDRVEWSIHVFVPQESGYNVDTLSFTGLSLEQYQQDREFLEHIIRSMRYEAVHGAFD